ncbi:unnamed protein product [Microthlaspi erraticum]|uniref:Uncharacterized protein n=1 Tax=Microthlaspi erraticum TaxID=1685480 RepID=A0A6D2KYW7_9BRAS|nr:unnamed protein product [Microthlaspi erraticum]
MFAINFNFDCQTLIRSIFRCFAGKGYIRNLRDNLRDLRRESENLKATQQEVKDKVARDEAQPRKMLWLGRVENTDIEFDDLLSTADDHLTELCLWDICSKNLWSSDSSHAYGKRVFLLLEDIKTLKQEGDEFKEGTGPALRFEDQRQQPQAVQIQQTQAGQRQQPVLNPQGCLLFNVSEDLMISKKDDTTYWTFMSESPK